MFRVCTMVCTMCIKSHVEVYRQYLRIRPYLEWSVQRELVKIRPHSSRTGPQSSVCPKEGEVDTDTRTGRTPGEDGRCWINKGKPRDAKTVPNHQKLMEGPGTDGPSQPSGGSSPADASRLRHRSIITVTQRWYFLWQHQQTRSLLLTRQVTLART